jgi:hypothetical protein
MLINMPKSYNIDDIEISMDCNSKIRICVKYFTNTIRDVSNLIYDKIIYYLI